MSAISQLIQGTQQQAAPAQTNVPGATPAPPADPLQQFPKLKELESGAIPGVYILKGHQFPPEAMSITPQVLASMGLHYYRPIPKDHKVDIAIFNPKAISLEAVQKADKEGQLTQVLRPVTSIVQSANEKMDKAAPSDSPPANEPSAAPTPIMPKPSFGSDAQRVAAQFRMKALSAQLPSNREIPGGGTVLNGLVGRAM